MTAPIDIKFPHKLMKKQAEFLESTARYTVYSGGVGSGKTLVGCYKALNCAINYPKSKGLIGTQTYPQLRDTTQRTLFEIIEAIDYPIVKKFNSTNGILEFINGSIIYFRTLDNESTLRSYNLDWFYIDEATTVKYASWNQLRGRIRKGVLDIGFVTTNPDTYFHWLYEDVIDKYIKGDLKDNDYKVIFATSLENKHLPDTYINDLQSLDQAFVNRFVLGQWGNMEGMVYPMFNKDTHVKEFEHDKFKYYFRSIDPGFTNPFCCLFIGLDFDNNIHVFDEIYQSQVLDDDKITMIKAKHASYHYNNTYVDPEDANFRAVLRKHGIQNRASLKDVMKGIMKVQEKLAIKENGLPSLYIHPKCKNLINELQFYKWEESKIDKPIKEQPVKIKDHAVDALRYFVYTHYKYYSGGASNIGAD